MSPSNHEEADTRVFLHAKDMARNDHTQIAIRTVDTDVLVLAISAFYQLEDMVEKLWVDFGAGKNRSFFPVHEIYNDIGESKARGLPFFHAFTGCDQVSFLSHVTKKSAWKVWELFEEVTPVFITLSNKSSTTDVRNAIPILERFTVLLYSRTSNVLTTNECRRELFCQGRSIDNIYQQGLHYQSISYDLLTLQDMFGVNL